MNKRGKRIIDVDEDYINKLQAIYLLRTLKRYMNLKDLSRITGLDETLISKYVHSIILPNPRRAKELLTILLNTTSVLKILHGTIKSSLLTSIHEYPDILNLASHNIDILNFYVLNLIKKLNRMEVSKILTVEGGGLMIAGMMAPLLSLDVVYCLRDKYVPNSLIEYVNENPAYSNFLSLPITNIFKGESLIIIDDIVLTGITIKTMYKLARRAHAKVSAIVTLFVNNEKIAKKLEREISTRIIYEIPLQ